MTKNFLLSEFRSKDGSNTPPPVVNNLIRLAENLEALRAHFGRPISINSGYRSPVHNEKVGGSKNSQHLTGKAADIVIKDTHPDQVADAIETLIAEGKMSEGGLGRYKSFTHYDIRGTKARWDFR